MVAAMAGGGREERRGRRVRLAILIALAVLFVGGGWVWRRVDSAAARRDARRLELTLQEAARTADPTAVRSARDAALIGDYRAIDRLAPMAHQEALVPERDRVRAVYRIRDHHDPICFVLVLSTERREDNRVDRC
jgi:hypothetical protein